MKFTLERGETLDVTLVENDRVVGTLSLELKGVFGGAKSAKMVSAAASEKTDGRKPRRRLSAEARARMAEAQKRRWDKKREGVEQP